MSWLIDFAPRWHYLGVLVACLVLTLPLELVLGARVYRRPRQLVMTIAIASTPFLLWDLAAVNAGHWWYSARHTLGVDLGPLPLEEVLFFVVIPICALLTYGAVCALRDGNR